MCQPPNHAVTDIAPDEARLQIEIKMQIPGVTSRASGADLGESRCRV
jgi:hypothetical protein